MAVEDYSQWRQQARALLQRGVAPTDVAWQTTGQAALAFCENAEELLTLPIQHEELRIPRRFFQLAKNVACVRDNSRWPLLYSVAWRLLFDNHDLLNLKIDEQVARLTKMQKAVARDKHKMQAFVRFRRVTGPTDGANHGSQDRGDPAEYFVAWFEPQHLILAAMAPFFKKRFANMRWSILTPDACAHWDLQQLTFTAGAPRAPRVDDELEGLWLEYYKNIFNPARLKLKAMQAEMPKKYWANLPEAALIGELTRQAPQRVSSMINAECSAEWDKTAESSDVKDAHKQ